MNTPYDLYHFTYLSIFALIFTVLFLCNFSAIIVAFATKRKAWYEVAIFFSIVLLPLSFFKALAEFGVKNNRLWFDAMVAASALSILIFAILMIRRNK